MAEACWSQSCLQAPNDHTCRHIMSSVTCGLFQQESQDCEQHDARKLECKLVRIKPKSRRFLLTRHGPRYTPLQRTMIRCQTTSSNAQAHHWQDLHHEPPPYMGNIRQKHTCNIKHKAFVITDVDRGHRGKPARRPGGTSSGGQSQGVPAACADVGNGGVLQAYHFYWQRAAV